LRFRVCNLPTKWNNLKLKCEEFENKFCICRALTAEKDKSWTWGNFAKAISFELSWPFLSYFKAVAKWRIIEKENKMKEKENFFIKLYVG
jgi:hypothetical protein